LQPVLKPEGKGFSNQLNMAIKERNGFVIIWGTRFLFLFDEDNVGMIIPIQLEMFVIKLLKEIHDIRLDLILEVLIEARTKTIWTRTFISRD
jgi:hypothetical protein